MYLCLEFTSYSLPHIGREFGGRDHTTTFTRADVGRAPPLPVHGIAALLCVVATAEACRRSLVARRFTDRYGF
jgi:hypothetical protein